MPPPFNRKQAACTGMIAISIGQYVKEVNPEAKIKVREWDHIDNYLLVECGGELFHVYVKLPEPKKDIP